MMSDIARVCAKPGSRAAAAAGAGRLALGRAAGGPPRRREHVEIHTRLAEARQMMAGENTVMHALFTSADDCPIQQV